MKTETTDTDSIPVDTIPTDGTPLAETTDVNYRPRRFKRGRHPESTPGAFGGKRKSNGIKFRKSSLISRYV